jgi:hypothetical protein
MPFHTIWEQEGVKWDFYGFVTAEEIWEANMSFFKDPRSKTAKYQLVHTLKTIDLEWKPMDIVEVTLEDVAASRKLRRLKLAFIYNNDIIRAKIEKYVNISRNLNSDWHFRGFESEEEARLWLNGQ